NSSLTPNVETPTGLNSQRLQANSSSKVITIQPHNSKPIAQSIQTTCSNRIAVTRYSSRAQNALGSFTAKQGKVEPKTA
ncbi:hypothetical protein U1Q18_007787, partial [Sarracenia purpurea var. burkii]